MALKQATYRHTGATSVAGSAALKPVERIDVMSVFKVFGVFFAYTAAVLLLILYLCEGSFTYALDDSYIHLALAKHLVENQVWGVTAYEPSASSSSIVWPLLLSALMMIVGTAPLTGFYLSLGLAIGFTFWLHSTLRSLLPQEGPLEGVALRTALLSCVFTLVFIGMEHIFQVWVCLAFALGSARLLAQPRPNAHSLLPVLLLSVLVTSARYEGFALVGSVCILFALRHGVRNMAGRSLLFGVAVGAAALLPVVLFGFMMHRMELPLLPYSVQLKAWAPTVAIRGFWLHLGPKFLINCLSHPEILFLLIGCAITLRTRYQRGLSCWTVPAILQKIYLITAFVHLEFAMTGVYARYVAYLTALGVVALALESGPLFQQGFRLLPRSAYPRRAYRFVAVSTMGTLILFAAIAHLALPIRAWNIYNQQIQMARFLGTYYNGQAVALNDIGAPSFLTDIQMVDIFGLASKEVAETRLHGDYGADDIDRLTREKDVQVAIVYDRWFRTVDGSLLPTHWKKVGTWRIPFNINCGWHTVSIYAVAPDAKATLIRNLSEFSEKLPDGITEAGVYLEK